MDVQLSTGLVVKLEQDRGLDLGPLFDAIIVEHLVKHAGEGMEPQAALEGEIDYLIATAPLPLKDSLLRQLVAAALYRHWREYIRAVGA